MATKVFQWNCTSDKLNATLHADSPPTNSIPGYIPTSPRYLPIFLTLLLSDKWAVWLICYYSKDSYSPSIHQSRLPHLIILRSWKEQGVWTIQRFILFLISFYKKLYFIHEYYTVLLTFQLAFVDWHGCHVD